MKKYWVVAKNEFLKHFLVYRYFIISYAGGNFFELFSQIIIWAAIFRNVPVINGYNYEEMLSYIVIGWIFRFLTTNYEYEAIISKDIKLGSLSNFIVKPVDYLKYSIAYSLGRLAVAFVVVIFQSMVWIAIFHNELTIKINFATFFILCLMFILSYIIKLFVAMAIGFIAFWTTEVNGLSYAINAIIKILAGAYFPLDVISGTFSKIVLGFPFAYTLYYPTQIFLGRIGTAEAFRALGIMMVWVVFLWVCIQALWKIGLKKYESAGI